VMMRILMKTAMRPEKLLGAEQRHRIPWDEPVR